MQQHICIFTQLHVANKTKFLFLVNNELSIISSNKVLWFVFFLLVTQWHGLWSYKPQLQHSLISQKDGNQRRVRLLVYLREISGVSLYNLSCCQLPYIRPPLPVKYHNLLKKFFLVNSNSISPKLGSHKFPLAKMVSLLVRLFGHGVVWVDVGIKYISELRGVYVAYKWVTLQDCVTPSLWLAVVLQSCVPSNPGRAWGSLPPWNGAGCPLRWLLGKEMCILPETSDWKTSKAGGVAQSP